MELNIALAVYHMQLSGHIAHYNSEQWGATLAIMEQNGKAFVRTYWFNDDPQTIYIEGFSVSTEFRNKNFGTQLLNLTEKIAFILKMTKSRLWVKQDSWVHDWYSRVGYADFKQHEYEKTSVWMEKVLQR